MQLYIQIVDGQPFEHPIFEDNFCQAFPNIDLQQLPPEFAKFERKEPTPGEFEMPDYVEYRWDNGVVKDFWIYRPMTEDEKELTIRLSLNNQKDQLSGNEPNVIG